MSIDNLRVQIEESNGKLSNHSIHIKIKAKNEVQQLINLLSYKNLQIKSLSIEVDKDVSDYFISQFEIMALSENYPKITELAFPKIKLSHDSWKILFAVLPRFINLQKFDLSDSNFDYINDLSYLGSYLATNPKLKDLHLYNDNKILDQTYQSGSPADKLLGYLIKNTHLTGIEYGHRLDFNKKMKFSEKIKQKFEFNHSLTDDQENISRAASHLKDDHVVQELRNNLDTILIGTIKESVRKDFKQNKNIRRDVEGMPINRKMLLIELLRLETFLNFANQSPDFKGSEKANKAEKLLTYYQTQYRLINALDDMYLQEIKASSHDRPILHNLREDFLDEWDKVLNMSDSIEKNSKMEELFDGMIQKCTNADVKDKTSDAAIKNVLLILVSVATLFAALIVYAAVTRESRAKSGSFFFKDQELSKPKVDEVKNALEGIQYAIKNNP